MEKGKASVQISTETDSYPIPRILENFNQLGLGRAGGGLVHVFPGGCEGERHQDALYAGAGGVEAKGGASVVDEVEFNVPTAAELLPFLVLECIRHILSIISIPNSNKNYNVSPSSSP